MLDRKVPRILIIDRHPVVFEGLSLYLSSLEYMVLGGVTNTREARECIGAQAPDVVILDIDLVDGDGIDLVHGFSESRDRPDFLVFSAQPTKYYAIRSLAAGASGFVSKSDDISKVAKALAAIGDGYSYFPEGTRRHGKNILSDQQMLEALTDREIAAFKVLAREGGRQHAQDASGASRRSFSAVKPILYRKLGVSSVVELIDLARRSGFS
ncbi:response regulator transcription factor [Halomonas cupida]|uniref:response regulator n=1 Tax=Halomonas cupida TaxID=44933 RepID=UPI0039B61CB5